MRKIDRKLKACHNPLTDPDSDAYKEQAAAAEQQQREERDLKVGRWHHFYSIVSGRYSCISCVNHDIISGTFSERLVRTAAL